MEILLFLVLAAFVFDCYRRIGVLEKKQQQLAVARSISSSPESSLSTALVSSSEEQTVSKMPKPVSEMSAEIFPSKRPVSDRTDVFFQESRDTLHFLGDDWLVKVGVLLLVLSLGWFVTYAFTHDWIGPVGRVTLGMLFGLALLVAGTWRFEKSSVQGISLLAGGVASLYVSIFAGMTLYAFYTPIAGLFFMGLVTVYVAILSGVRKSRPLSIATLIFGLLAPLFVFDAVGITVLFVYLFLLSVCIIAVDVLLGWRATTLATLVGVFLYSLISYINGDIDRSFSSFVMVSLFTLLFYGANVGTIIFTRSAKGYDLGVTAFVGFAFFSWVFMTADSDFIGMIFVGAALLFALSSFAISSFFKLYEPMLLYAAVSVGFLFAATARIFDGSALTVLLAVEIGGLVLASLAFLREKNFQVGKMLTLLLIWPCLLSLENIQRLIGRNGLVHYGGNQFGSPVENLFVLVVMAGVFGIIAFSANRILAKLEEDVIIFSVTRAFAIGYALTFVWFFLHVFIPGYYVASMLALILFTIVGLSLYVHGTFAQKSSFRGIGIALFIVVLVRLFLVEFWTMSSVEKIITFFVVGALFLSTAFLLQKKVSRVEEYNSNI